MVVHLEELKNIVFHDEKLSQRDVKLMVLGSLLCGFKTRDIVETFQGHVSKTTVKLVQATNAIPTHFNPDSVDGSFAKKIPRFLRVHRARDPGRARCLPCLHLVEKVFRREKLYFSIPQDVLPWCFEQVKNRNIMPCHLNNSYM